VAVAVAAPTVDGRLGDYVHGVSRPPGTRNADYAASRDALARAMGGRMLLPGGAQASLRELAASAGVSVPTLRHYFGSRDGALAAALQVFEADAAPWLALTRDPGDGDARASLGTWAPVFVAGWRQFGVGRLQVAGLTAGLGQAALGPVYLEKLLEPVQQALEERLRRLMVRGQLREGDPRVAAVQLLAPLVIVLLHQDALGGDHCRPLEVDGFVAAHLDAFLRGWAP